MKTEYYIGTSQVSKEVYDTVQVYKKDNLLLAYENDKYKKALGILKKKQCIHILALKRSANWRAYNEFILPLNRYNGIKLFDKLTQKEYKILKEVLK